MTDKHIKERCENWLIGEDLDDRLCLYATLESLCREMIAEGIHAVSREIQRRHYDDLTTAKKALKIYTGLEDWCRQEAARNKEGACSGQ